MEISINNTHKQLIEEEKLFSNMEHEPGEMSRIDKIKELLLKIKTLEESKDNI